MAATVALTELVAYLDDLLATGGPDFCPNGLQVEGRREVGRIVTGVSACLELFQHARRVAADAVVVHHGLFWDDAPVVLTGVLGRRVHELFAGGMSLLAYHLPLDRHPELGNNAVAARAFGLERIVSFAEHAGETLGFRGSFAQASTPGELVARCRAIYGQEPQAFLAGPDRVRTLGIVSGAAEKVLHQAIALGLDAFVTGEISEWVMNVAREARIHFLAAGHYATERLGVEALGRHLAERFGLAVDFVDVPNPI